MAPQKRTMNNGIEILVVEDSPTQAEQLKHILEQHDYSVSVANNGKEALSLINKHKPTIVISDIIMPEMDGYQLCRQIKADENLKEIPVILLTSLSGPTTDVIKGLESGANNFIMKPYNEEYLLSRINYIIANRELRKSENLEIGIEILFAGQKYFINSERRQILDLLLSTYEEAVRINEKLRVKQKELARANEVLNGLYRIAKEINWCTSVQEVVEKALEQAVGLPGVQAGWISLREGPSGFRTVATHHLPPALEAPGMWEEDCLCRRKLLSGELSQVMNILECERLQKAKGDTRGLRYHASVPLWIGDRILGLMNLAGAEQGLFSDEDLKILNGMGNQIATALGRAELYENLEREVEERTAALTAEIAEHERVNEVLRETLAQLSKKNHYETIISTVTRSVHQSINLQDVLENTVEAMSKNIDGVNDVSIYLVEGQEAVIKAHRGYRDWFINRVRRIPYPNGFTWKTIMEGKPVYCADVDQDTIIGHAGREVGTKSYASMPIRFEGKTVGVININSLKKNAFDDEDLKLLETVRQQIEVAINNAQQAETLQQSEEALARQAQELARSNAKLEQLLAELEQTRQQQLRLKDQFLSHVSHELRSPLTAIYQFVTILLDRLAGELNLEQHEYLEIILKNVNQLRTMIEDLLEISRVQVGKLSVEPQPISLVNLIEETLSSLRTAASAKSITLSAKFPSDLPSAYADPQRIRQILTNLIDNGIKFTPENGMINVRVQVSNEEPYFLCVAVSDTGCGLSSEESKKIFERLYQSKSTFQYSRKGLGLGLYICKDLVSSHGGRIWIESQLGHGSTFFFTLPIFSLAALLTPILTAENLLKGLVGLIAIEIFPSEKRPLTRTDETVLREVRIGVERSILPFQGLLMHRTYTEWGETLFAVALADQSGVEIIVQRIQEQLALYKDFRNADFDSAVSFTMIDIPSGINNKPLEQVVRDIASSIEDLIKTKHSQKEYSNV